MPRLRSGTLLVRQVIQDYFEDKAPRLAAALAYYALFALAPLMLVIIAVGGLAFGPGEMREAVEGHATSLFGPEGGRFVAEMVERAGSGRSGLLGAALGTIVLLIGATGVFIQLQDALNTVWEVKLRPGLPLAKRLRRRLRAFAIVMAVAFILLVSLALSAAIAWLTRWNDSLPGSDVAWSAADALLSITLLTVVFAFMYKAIPDAEIEWRDVWVGAALTALLFAAGKLALGLYLGRPEVAATFGAASAAVIIVLWVYYCAQLVLLGAEVTQAYARARGRGIRPDADAVPVTEEARAQEGMAG